MHDHIQALRGRRRPLPRPSPSTDARPKAVSCSDVEWCAVCDKSLLTSQADALLVDEDNEVYLPIHPACRPAS